MAHAAPLAVVPPLLHLTPLDPAYPSRLRGLEGAPASMTVRGGSVEAQTTVAVVGSRKATPDARRFARALAGELASAGVVVVSGGALGIDASAHRGALDARGRTWAVAGTGHERCFPPDHRALFERIAKGPGAMIWPFAPHHRHRSAFLARNQYLAALSDAVVVVQAGRPSGALHAAACARRLGKAVWVVPATPWQPRFQGSVDLLDEGAQPLTSSAALLRALADNDRAPDRNRAARTQSRTQPEEVDPPSATIPLSDYESATLRATSTEPRHADAIAAVAGLSPQATTAALLTLALENVLVEGPPGFFRRRVGHNH